MVLVNDVFKVINAEFEDIARVNRELPDEASEHNIKKLNRNLKYQKEMNQEIVSLIPSGDQFVLSGSGKLIRRSTSAK